MLCGLVLGFQSDCLDRLGGLLKSFLRQQGPQPCRRVFLGMAEPVDPPGHLACLRQIALWCRGLGLSKDSYPF